MSSFRGRHNVFSPGAAHRLPSEGGTLLYFQGWHALSSAGAIFYQWTV